MWRTGTAAHCFRWQRTSTLNNPASVRENTMDRPETRAAPDRRPHRLYPSLPDADRWDARGPALQTPAEFRPEARPEGAQPEAAAGGHGAMKAQVLALEERKQELFSINEQWAKEYQTMARYYQQKVRDLKSLLRQSRGPAEDEAREPEEPHVAADDKEGKWTEDAEAAAELLEELRAQNVALTRRGQHQHDEIVRLNKALEKSLQTSQPLGCSETLQELWKHQAEVYREDFLKERKDRESLKEKYLELKKRFVKVHNELCVFKCQLTGTPTRPVPDCSNRAVRQVNQPNTRLQRRYAGDDKQ